MSVNRSPVLARSRIIGAIAVLAGAAVVVASPAQAAGGIGATFAKDSDWGSGYSAHYTITNGTSSAISSWTVGFTLAAGLSVTSSWDATFTGSTGQITAANKSYNGTVAAGASVSFGFN